MVIAIEHLTRTYGTCRAVDGLSLNVPEGSLFGFLGPNGAGKTTTIRILLGLLRPTAGSASLFGHDCWEHAAKAKRDIGTVAGEVRLPSYLTGHVGLSMFGAIRGMDLRRIGRDLANRFDLDLSIRAGRMSKGMRQKLALVLALAHQPRLLILDEPTSGLDPLMQDEFRRLLLEWNRRGHTVFFSSHTLSEVEQICERIAIVRAGRLVVDQPLRQLRHDAGHEVHITWRTPCPDAPWPGDAPSGLRLMSKSADGRTWVCRATGSFQPILMWLAAVAPQVEDYSVTRPDLESLFREFYATPQSTEPPEPARGRGDVA